MKIPMRCFSEQEHVTCYLQIQSAAIANLAPQVYRQMDGRSVHKLRVATRRARAVLWLLKHGSQHMPCKKLNNNLRTIGKALGDVRELDVAILDAGRYGIDSFRLTLRRKIAQQKLHKLINRDQREKLSEDLQSLENVMRNLEPLLLGKTRNKLRAKLTHQLDQTIHGKKQFHQLRVIFKKVRYVLEAIGKSVVPIKRLQTILGDAHDQVVLEKLLGKNPKSKLKRHCLNEKATRLAKSVIRFAVTQLGPNPKAIRARGLD